VVLSNGVVGKRPFLVALAAAGISRDDQSRLTKAFAGVRKFDRCHPTDAFTVAREAKTGKLLAFEFATSPADVYQARRDEAGTLQAKRLELRVERLAVAVALTVGEDLRESVVKAGLDDDMLKMLDDALHGHVELSSLRRGARLRVLASEDRIEGEFGRYAELEAVEYNAPGPGAAALRVYHFGPATPPNASAPVKLGGYYDAQGRQPYHGGWRSPVPMARLSSRFNPRRKHPVLHIIMPHNGVDFAAPSGTPVYATGPGVIRSVGDGGPCGNMVQIQHSNGLVSAYCHLSRFGGVQLGQHVEGRQLIGYVGQTGRATGPHLHFAIKRGEAFMDPLALKLDGVRVVPPADRGEFARRREEFDARLDTIALSAPLADVDGGADTSDAEVINELPPEGPGTNP
jgi:murein DD-endopeptidase MepM/ murein hydrolase activator NlpD